MKRLESGRSIALLVMFTALSLIAAVLTSDLARVVLLIAAVFIGALILVLSVSWARRVEARRRQDYRNLMSVAKDLSLLRNMSGSVAKSRESQSLQEKKLTLQEKKLTLQEEKLTRIDSAVEALLQAEKAERERMTEPLSYFAPSRISASKTVNKPNSHVAGRQAAQQDTGEGSHEKLWELLYPSNEMTRMVAVLGSSDLLESLSGFCSVQKIDSAFDLAKASNDVSWLVIEEAFLTRGRWFGSLSAQGTRLFQELHTEILKAKRLGNVLTVVVANAPSSHMTSVLRDNADVVLPRSLNQESQGAEIANPVIKAIDAYARK